MRRESLSKQTKIPQQRQAVAKMAGPSGEVVRLFECWPWRNEGKVYRSWVFNAAEADVSRAESIDKESEWQAERDNT
jgi:hypothetical protein